MIIKQAAAAESAKSGPAIILAAGSHFFGMALSDLVSILLIVYTAAQLAYLLWKWRKEVNGSK